MKKNFIILIVVAILAGCFWYITGAGWFSAPESDNLPTKEDWNRMEAVEESSSQIAPNAKAGIQVREPGSTPPPAPTPSPVSTSTATTTL